MVVNFTDLEKKYLIIKKASWSIDENCPKEIRKKLQEKIRFLTKEQK